MKHQRRNNEKTRKTRSNFQKQRKEEASDRFSQVLHREVSSLELREEATEFDEKEPFGIFEGWWPKYGATLIIIIFMRC